MKILTFILLAGCLQLSAHCYSQGITLSLHNAVITTAFKEIEKQSPYRFVYTDEQLKGVSPISVSVENAPLQKVLELCFKDLPLTFSIEDLFIMVKRKDKFLPTNSIIENELKGRVTNQKGEALAGATIMVKGTQKGTTTDQNGYFSMPQPPPGSVIIISSIGYEKQELMLGKNNSLNIHLIIAASGLDEVHIIGYGTTTKRLSTGSISKVGTDIIEKQPVTNLLEALEGRVAGLQITQSTGLPGSPIMVQIRGQNSIAASNDPLYIVDGVPFTSTPVEPLGGANGNSALNGSPLNSINPADIESIQILKDADATAIYGSRASNGVILITTKKGKAGKAKFDFIIRTGVGAVTHMAQTLNTKEHLQVRRDALANSGLNPSVSNAPDILSWDTTKYTNWQNYYAGGTAKLTDASAGFSGGNQQTTFLISGTYHNESSVLPVKTNYERTGLHLNIEHRSLDQKFNLNATAFYVSDRNYLCGQSGTFFQMARAIPDYPTYDASGNLNWTANQTNYVAQLKGYNKTQTDNLNGSVVLGYSILPGLNLKASLGFNKIETNQIFPYPISSQNPAFNPTGFTAFGNQSIKTYLFEPQATYTSTIGQGKWNVLCGATFQNNMSNSQQLSVSGYSNDLLLESLNYGTLDFKSASTIVYKYLSLFGRITYNWKDKYIVNGSFRRDGSTRFGPGKQFGNFGSIGAAWIFSNADLFKASQWLSFGKLRASYGTTGNDGIADYGYLSIYTSTLPYGTNTAIIPSQIANPDFQWEINKKLEVALELGILKDRILFTAAWYRNRSGNQLVGYALPSITGFDSYQANLPALVQNTGWEFEINSKNIKTNNLAWNSSFNLTVPKNKLLAFPQLAASSYANNYVIGQDLSIIQGYHFLGVDPQTGKARINDINKDGVITPSSSYNNQNGDYTIIGKISPDWYFGLNNTIHYKNLELDIFFQYTNQVGYNIYRNSGVFGRMFNVTTDYLGYWKQPGDQGSLPKPMARFDNSLYNFSKSDATVNDASFLRLKNISLYYSVPEKWISHLKINSLRLFIQGQNLLTFTRYKGNDPETASSATPYLPPLKILTAGIQCSL